MEENIQHFWHIMFYYFKKGKNTTETQKFCAAYGEDAMTDQTCQNWFAKFRAGDFLLGDAPQSGRPVEVDRDQIETLIENNQCSPTWEIVNILKISKSIKLLVKMKNMSFILQKNLNGLLVNPISVLTYYLLLILISGESNILQIIFFRSILWVLKIFKKFKSFPKSFCQKNIHK